ncbi:MAG: type II secretion system F family protein [Elusimicrobiaceae bacterium]|nr:type II secretion system F family protein [Elusimicrobiaceae bacterium]
MAKFIYTVRDLEGKIYKGSIEAPNKSQAIDYLQQKGVMVIEVSLAATAKSGLGSLFHNKVAVGNVKPAGHVLAFFAEQLSTLISGGVPLVRAIKLLGDFSSDKYLGPVLVAVARDVASGNTLNGALAKYPKVFDYTWVSMVQAGEVGGQLAESLMQIANYVKSNEALKSKIITAVTYPGVLFIMAIGVLIYFVVGIVPTFAQIFSDFNLTLPALTLAIVSISTAIRTHLILILLIVAFLIGAFIFAIRTPSGKRVWHRFHLTMPIFGNFISNIYYERILSSMSTLLNSGVSIINVLSVMENAFAGNVLIQNALIQARKDVASGKSTSEAFRRTAMFPGLMTEMMMMGEESGRLPHILTTLAKFYTEQINQFIARFSALIDPILIVGIGAIIAVIVLSIFMPIFKMSEIGSNM